MSVRKFVMERKATNLTTEFPGPKTATACTSGHPEQSTNQEVKKLSKSEDTKGNHVFEDDRDQYFDAVEAPCDTSGDTAVPIQSICRLKPSHPLSQEILAVSQMHWDSWGVSTTGMELIEDEGPLRVYRNRLEQNGEVLAAFTLSKSSLILRMLQPMLSTCALPFNIDALNPTATAVDPILATHTVTGVTAREVAEMFWNLQYRLDWERTLESAPIVLDTLSSDTLLLHQIYKRLWPTAQRDSVFWSHIRHAEQRTMVVNCSTEIGAPPLASDRQRMQLNVCLICETEMPDGRLPTERSQLRCQMQYSARVHPGGWAPKAILRQLARREYPRFLKRFAAFCVERAKHAPISQLER